MKIRLSFITIFLIAVCIFGGKNNVQAAPITLPDGDYQIEVSLSGGSGRASIASPTNLQVKDGLATAEITFSSSNYDYMKVNGVTYYPVNTEGNSCFEIPVALWDEEITVVADTTAMSTPHEITYQLLFSSASVQSNEKINLAISGKWIAIICIAVFLAILLLIIFGKRFGIAKTTRVIIGIGIIIAAGIYIGTGQLSRKAPEAADRNRNDYAISSDLQYLGQQQLLYATGFTIADYEGGYHLISTADGSRLLVVPKNGAIPQDLAKDISVISEGSTDIYLAASAMMDMFVAMDAVDCIRLSSIKESDWHIEEAVNAMAQGEILYAGKYSAPDYELLKEKGTALAIESTMVEHVPEVKEQLTLLGIPVFVDRSSYEPHPIGRMEWIKVYGCLTGRSELATAAFDEQKDAFLNGISEERFDKKVAFFNVTSTGAVSVRKPGDYIAKMITMAGGDYVFADMQDTEGGTGSMTLQMESFYAQAKDADILIYNSTIVGEIYSVEQLCEMSPLFADFKAVKEGNVWCISGDFYQNSMSLGTATDDFHKMLMMEETEDESREEEFTFLFKLNR